MPGQLQIERGQRIRSKRKTYLQFLGLARKAVSSVVPIVGTAPVCSPTPEPLAVFSVQCTGHQNVGLKQTECRYFSGKEFQFRICNHGELYASPQTPREGNCFYRGEKEAGRAVVKKESKTFHWLNPCQERRVFLLSFGLSNHRRE